MKLIYVASPYAGDIEKNVRFAKEASRFVMSSGHAFFAPHLLYPAILDDGVPEERALGMEMGTTVLSKCDELWAFGERVSPGMQSEIAEAQRLGIPVRRITLLGGSAAYKGWNFELCATGDVCADLLRKDDPGDSLLYVKDKQNAGRFGEEIQTYITTDKALNSALCHSHPQYQLLLDNNNWWECFVIDPSGGFHDLMWCLDSDSIISAIAEVIAGMDETITELCALDTIPAAG